MVLSKDRLRRSAYLVRSCAVLAELRMPCATSRRRHFALAGMRRVYEYTPEAADGCRKVSGL